jgi:hypothetical protein
MTLKWWHAVLLGLGWLLFLGALLQGRKTVGDLLDGNEEIAARLKVATVARERAEWVSDSLIAAHDTAQAKADTAISVADSGRVASERGHRAAARRAREMAEGNVALIAEIDRMEDANALLADSYDSLRSEYRQLEQRFMDARLGYEAEVLTWRAERGELVTDRDYWKKEAIGLATEWSLVGWLPRGWRTTGRVAICAIGGGLIAWGASATAEDVPSGAVAVAGLGSAGLCSVGAFGL